MEPRSFERGKDGYDVRTVEQECASMEPRSFERGKEALRRTT